MFRNILLIFKTTKVSYEKRFNAFERKSSMHELTQNHFS